MGMEIPGLEGQNWRRTFDTGFWVVLVWGLMYVRTGWLETLRQWVRRALGVAEALRELEAEHDALRNENAALRAENERLRSGVGRQAHDVAAAGDRGRALA